MLYSEHSIAETEVESPLHVAVIVTRGALAHYFSDDCITALNPIKSWKQSDTDAYCHSIMLGMQYGIKSQDPQ